MLGDVLQTTPLLEDLIRETSRNQIDLLVLRQYEHILRRLPGLGNIFSLPIKWFEKLEKPITDGFQRNDVPSAALVVLQELGLPSYDRIISCSTTALGCWLTGRIAAETREGGVITDQGEALYYGDHHIYLIARQLFRQENWFNLVDLWRCGAALRRMPGPGMHLHLHKSEDLPFALPEGRLVALNPGSTASHRRWPAEYFARLAEDLRARGFVPILVGAPADQPVCAEVRKAYSFLRDFSGQTSIAEMARLISAVDLLVSNDTGAVHIAAAMGMPVLGLYGASAYFAETAPWGTGHLILQAALGDGGVALSPQLVLAAALNRLGLVPEDSLRRELGDGRTTAWETFFLPPQSDPLGGLSYRPVHRIQLEAEDLFIRALRHAFASRFCGGGEISLDYLQTWADTTHLSGSANGTAEIRAAIEPALTVLDNMAMAAARCRNLCGTVTAESSAQISSLTESLISALESLKGTAVQYAPLGPVIHYLDWKFRFMPPLSPEATFRFHEKEYRNAAGMLRQAAALVESYLRGERGDRAASKALGQNQSRL